MRWDKLLRFTCAVAQLIDFLSMSTQAYVRIYQVPLGGREETCSNEFPPRAATAPKERIYATCADPSIDKL